MGISSRCSPRPHNGEAGVIHYTWAEPGDPPTADYKSVRAQPLAKPLRYGSVDLHTEIALIRAYHDDGDLDALDRLVEAHRPMVVRMAKNTRRGSMSLKVLVE